MSRLRVAVLLLAAATAAAAYDCEADCHAEFDLGDGDMEDLSFLEISEANRGVVDEALALAQFCRECKNPSAHVMSMSALHTKQSDESADTGAAPMPASPPVSLDTPPPAMRVPLPVWAEEHLTPSPSASPSPSATDDMPEPDMLPAEAYGRLPSLGAQGGPCPYDESEEESPTPSPSPSPSASPSPVIPGIMPVIPGFDNPEDCNDHGGGDDGQATHINWRYGHDVHTRTNGDTLTSLPEPLPQWAIDRDARRRETGDDLRANQHHLPENLRGRLHLAATAEDDKFDGVVGQMDHYTNEPEKHRAKGYKADDYDESQMEGPSFEQPPTHPTGDADAKEEGLVSKVSVPPDVPDPVPADDDPYEDPDIPPINGAGPGEHHVGTPTGKTPTSGPGLDGGVLKVFDPSGAPVHVLPPTPIHLPPPPPPEHSHVIRPLPEEHAIKEVVKEPTPLEDESDSEAFDWRGDPEPLHPEHGCDDKVVIPDDQKMPETSYVTPSVGAAALPPRPVGAPVPAPTAGEWNVVTGVSASVAGVDGADTSDDMPQSRYQVFGLQRNVEREAGWYDAIMHRSAEEVELDRAVRLASVQAHHMLSTPAGVRREDADGGRTELHGDTAWAFMNRRWGKGLPAPVDEATQKERVAAHTEWRREQTALQYIKDHGMDPVAVAAADTEPGVFPTAAPYTLPSPPPQPQQPPPPPPSTASSETVDTPPSAVESVPTLEAVTSAPTPADRDAIVANAADTMGLVAQGVVEQQSRDVEEEFVMQGEAGDVPQPAHAEPTLSEEEENSRGHPVDMRHVSMPDEGNGAETHELQMVVESETDASEVGPDDGYGGWRMRVAQPSVSHSLRNADATPLVRPGGLVPMLTPGGMMTEKSSQSDLEGMPVGDACKNDTETSAGLVEGDAMTDEAAPMVLPDVPCQQRSTCGACTDSTLCVWCPTLRVCVPGDANGAVSRFGCAPFAYGNCEASMPFMHLSARLAPKHVNPQSLMMLETDES